MRRASLLIGLAGAAALLAGCGHSPPTRFFTLDPMPPAQSPRAAQIAPVQLEAVHIPSQLDRPELVTQIGPNRLKVSDQDQWAAPLGDVMRRTLAQDLLGRLPNGALILPDAPRPADGRGLVVNILQLQTDASGRTVLQASWSLMAGHPRRAVITRTVELASNGAATADGQAAAISQLLGELADQIAAALSNG